MFWDDEEIVDEGTMYGNPDEPCPCACHFDNDGLRCYVCDCPYLGPDENSEESE